MEHLHVFSSAWSILSVRIGLNCSQLFAQMLLEIHSPKVKNIPAPN